MATDCSTIVNKSHSAFESADFSQYKYASYIWTHDPMRADIGYNLNGRTIGVTGVDDPDNYNLVEYSKNEEGGLQIVGGYCWWIMLDLQFLLKFGLKVVTSDAYIKEENGTLGGIGRQLLEGNADLTIPLSYLLPFRIQHIVALHPLIREPMLAIFHTPASTSVRDIYIGTLSQSLWIALLLMWFFVYCSYQILSFFNHLDLMHDQMECFLVIFASMSEQGWYKRGGRLPCSILTLVSIVFGYLVLQYFRATVITELTFERQLINGFNDLFSYGFKILTNPVQQWGRYIAPSIGRDSEEFMKEIASYYVDDNESVAKSIGGGYAFLTTWDYFVPLSRTLGFRDALLCNAMSAVTVGNMATYSGFYVQKNSTIKEPMNYGLVRILEHGLHSKHYKNLLSESTLKCLDKDFHRITHSATDLELRDVSTAFAILVSGLLFSFCFSILEKLYFIIKIKMKSVK